MKILPSIACRFASLLALIGLIGCNSTNSADNYSRNALQQANKVDKGIVVNVRAVTVDGTHFLGAAAGATGGAIAGSQIGHSSGSAVAALGGAIIGGIIGAAIEDEATKGHAYEYVIQVRPDDLVSLTQTDQAPLAIGEKVMVIYGVQARIIPDTSSPAEVRETIPRPQT